MRGEPGADSRGSCGGSVPECPLAQSASGRPRRTFQVQNLRNAFRCSAITVSRFTIRNGGARHSAQKHESPIQKSRSALFNDRRFFAERWRTPI